MDQQLELEWQGSGNMSGRRSDDHRFIKIEDDIKELKSDLKEIGSDMVLVKMKIFNGMGSSIKSTENKVNYIDKANKDDHKSLEDQIICLSKKFDKIMWKISIGTAGIVIALILKDFIISLL